MQNASRKNTKSSQRSTRNLRVNTQFVKQLWTVVYGREGGEQGVWREYVRAACAASKTWQDRDIITDGVGSCGWMFPTREASQRRPGQQTPSITSPTTSDASDN